ncbi:hypothetical protein [Paenarthrobacter nicotinovorans]|uniref:hypothetical protein n=1 Tax=Paenarthrobacter nicotinovorans TaxID=29320 RepID=UPI003749B194
MKTKTVPVSKLDLDLSNPRLARVMTDQPSALAEMLAVEGDSILKLASDIARRGQLNPVEPMIVVEEGGRFIVLEGNRRLCALRLMDRPKLAPEDERAKYERLNKTRLAAIKTASVAVAADRDQADDWIEMKHSQASGRGIKSWGPRQKENFRARRRGSISPLERIISAIETWYSDDEDLLQALDVVVHGGQYTNLDRILDAKETKEKLGLEIVDGRVLSYYDPADLKPFFSGLLQKLSTPLEQDQVPWSRVWNTTNHRKDWLNGSESSAPSDRLRKAEPVAEHTPVLGQSASSPAASNGGVTPASSRAPRDPFAGPKLRFSNVKVHAGYSNSVKKLVSELGNINVDALPNIAIDGIRTLVEKTIKTYAHLQGDTIPSHRGNFVGYGDCLHWLAKHVQDHDDLKRFQGTVQQMNTGKGKSWTLSAEALNAANHNEWAVFTPAEVKNIWGTIHDLLKVLLERGDTGSNAVATNTKP